MINQKLFITADKNLPFGHLPPCLRAHQSESVSYELCVCEISSAEAWENSRHVYGDGCKTMHLYARRGGERSMTGPAWLTGSPARKTHVSPGRTGSLPSSTGLGVYSPDLQILSSSSASPLPAWCSQSCSVSVQKMQDRIIIAFQKEVLCICVSFFFFLPFRISKIWLCLRWDWNELKEKNIWQNAPCLYSCPRTPGETNNQHTGKTFRKNTVAASNSNMLLQYWKNELRASQN